MIKNTVIWICGLATAILLASHAFGMIAVSANPLAALSLVPENGLVYASATNQLLRDAVTQNSGAMPTEIDARTGQLARKSFLSEPTAHEAVRLLAIKLKTEGKGDRARKLMQLVPLMTKRDSVANMWLVQEYGERNDLSAVLSYYDLTLRSSSSSSQVLIPNMVAALQNEKFIEPFAQILENQPPWTYRLWNGVLKTPKSLVNGARLRERLQEMRVAVDQDVDKELIVQLVRTKNFAAADKLYATLTSDLPIEDISGNKDFEAQAAYPPIDWEILSEGNRTAFIDPDRAELVISGVPSSTGVVARRLVKLTPGNYRVSIMRARASDKERSIELRAVVRCATDRSRKLNRNFRLSSDGYSNSFVVSQNCEHYWLELDITVPRTGSVTDIAIKELSIEKL